MTNDKLFDDHMAELLLHGRTVIDKTRRQHANALDRPRPAEQRSDEEIRRAYESAMREKVEGGL